MSKFTFGLFRNDSGDFLAVSQERYSREEAEKIALRELECPSVAFVSDNQKVRHRFYADDFGEVSNGWCLEGNYVKSGCQVYVYERG